MTLMAELGPLRPRKALKFTRAVARSWACVGCLVAKHVLESGRMLRKSRLARVARALDSGPEGSE